MDNNIQNRYSLVNSLVEKINNEELKSLSTFLGDRIDNLDSYVMMLGETSCGKSSIINGLMGENNLFVSAAPSTGAITEVEFKKNISNKEYYAINKNATIEEINKDVFEELTKKPDEELKRLKLITKSPKYKFSNMRLFDTPGYGSIIKEHEEVLKEFIPNSDIIIYTVNYKIGIQENDYAFLGFLKELIRDDVEIILVINRCPESVSDSNRRVVEIKKYVKDILHDDIATFLIKTETCENEYGYPLPACENLWSYVERILNSPKRIHMLEEIFSQYIEELLDKCENEIEKKYENIKLSKEQKEKIKQRSDRFVKNIENIKSSLIEPTFEKLINSLDRKMKVAQDNINNKMDESIENISNAKMDETIPYISNHLLPYCTQIEVTEIKRYIEIILDDLNNQVNDYLNTEIIQFNKDIEVCFSTATELAGKKLGKNVGKGMVNGGLVKYFSKFGGRGKAGAGVANAASHYLKVAGDMVGKKFSRATHNALKKKLSQIGATSMRAISNAAVVIVELLSIIIEYSTWKSKLKKKTHKATSDWYDECLNTIKDDLQKLKEENLEILTEIVNEEINMYNYSDVIEDENEILTLYNELNNVKIKLGVE